MEIDGVELVHEDLRILRFVVDRDGASASEIREALGITSSSTSSHRLDKLENAGLIISDYDGTDETARLPRRIARPTAEARDIVDILPEVTTQTLTAEQRIDRLEAQFDTARERVISLHQRVRKLEEELNSQQGFVFEESD